MPTCGDPKSAWFSLFWQTMDQGMKRARDSMPYEAYEPSAYGGYGEWVACTSCTPIINT